MDETKQYSRILTGKLSQVAQATSTTSRPDLYTPVSSQPTIEKPRPFRSGLPFTL
jgi:hypothetical protein